MLTSGEPPGNPVVAAVGAGTFSVRCARDGGSRRPAGVEHELGPPARGPPGPAPDGRDALVWPLGTRHAAGVARNSVVGIQQVGKPSVGVGEVLVGVHPATVNRIGCVYRAASPFFMRCVVFSRIITLIRLSLRVEPPPLDRPAAGPH